MKTIKPIKINNPNNIEKKFPKSKNPLTCKWIYRGQNNDMQFKTTLERACESLPGGATAKSRRALCRALNLWNKSFYGIFMKSGVNDIR